jgi:hypothetical protein
MEENNRRLLAPQGTLREPHFHSDVPLLGPLIAWFRESWNGVSTKWYVRDLVQQQSELNLLFIHRMDGLESRLDGLESRMDGLEGRLIDQDREATQLRRDVAEMTVQLIALRNQMASLDARLAELAEK